jgi:hypothetical protein
MIGWQLAHGPNSAPGVPVAERRGFRLGVLAQRAALKSIGPGVVPDLSATYQTYQWGGRRMRIATVFRDWQSGGFHRDR